MPRSYVIDRERDAILVTASGVFTDEEFQLGAAATVREPAFRGDLRVLVDFSAVTQFKVSAKTLSAFVAQRVFSAKSRRAFVVNSGFGRAFVEFGKLQGAPEQIQIFPDRAQAVAWLNEGVPPEKRLE